LVKTTTTAVRAGYFLFFSAFLGRFQ